MSSLFPNLRQQKPQSIDWAARLIPGAASDFRRGGKKSPQSVRFALLPQAEPQAMATQEAATVWGSLTEFLLPRALNNWQAGVWLERVAADFALIGLNWLIVGAIILQLRSAFPQVAVFQHPAIVPSSGLGVALLHAVLIMLTGQAEGLYKSGQPLSQQAGTLAKAVGWSTVLLGIALKLQGSPAGTSLTLCAAGSLHFGVLLGWRHFDRKRHGAAHPGRDVQNVIIVGAGDAGRRIASYLEDHPEEGRVVCGFLDDEKPVRDEVIGRVSQLAQVARAAFADEVILAQPCDREKASRVLHEARRLRLDVKAAPDLYGCEPDESAIEQNGNLPLFCLHRVRLPWPALLLKRALDIVGAVFGLMIFTPFFAVMAAIIKIDSSGPVIYAALRAGRKGRSFRCYKLRSMVQNANDLKDGLRSQNQRSGPCFKIAGDPRITRVGSFLRRYSLDELPQLWNVLNGEMSLVGPRPHPVDDYSAYEVGHLARLDMKPGMTGLWQVTARSDPSFQRGMELDREYIRHWSIGMDFKILRKTFAAVVRGSGQ